MPDEGSSSRNAIEPLAAGERRQLWGIGALAVCWAILPALGGFYLLAELGWASEQLTALGAAGLLVYAVIFAVTSGVGVLPTYAQAILGGWVFGAFLGTAGAVAGIVVGALIGFGLARVVMGFGVEKIIARRAQVVAVRDALVGKGWFRTFMLVALLRLSPNSPFALMNLAMGSARTPFLPYVLGTAIGIIPRTAIAAAIAAAAAADGSRDLGEVVTSKGLGMTIIGVVVLIAAFAIVGAIGKHALRKVMDQDASVKAE
ncbi:MAG: VTT domain-containing protein [Phycisphaerales bacterium]|nr:VTT domain-containing protein [Phycisphaerales bacterium]